MGFAVSLFAPAGGSCSPFGLRRFSLRSYTPSRPELRWRWESRSASCWVRSSRCFGRCFFLRLGTVLGVERFRFGSVRALEPSFLHTLMLAGFLHSQGDMMHVLGSDHPRTGWRPPRAAARFQAIFRNLCHRPVGWLPRLGGVQRRLRTPALGASGAAFGLLGAYLAGWPKDEIPSPCC